MDEATVRQGLIEFIREKSGSEVNVDNLVRLSGGASRETWAFDAELSQDGKAETIEAIFRCDPIPGQPTSVGRELEYHLIRAAWERGVVVPEPLWDGDDRFGVKFFIMRRLAGETIGTRLVRGPQYEQARAVVPEQLAQSLARIHAIAPGDYPELERLTGLEPGKSPAELELDHYEQSYRQSMPNPHPVFELAFRWCHQNLPEVPTSVLVHGDYRLGNFIFGEDGLRGVIDWELAHWGDPMEDLGWLAVRSWRFGGKQPMAGVGDREAFYAAYETAGGFPVDRNRVRFWELYGNLRWGAITVTQAVTYLSGRSKSVELASIGRRTAETEWELLNLLEGTAN